MIVVRHCLFLMPPFQPLYSRITPLFLRNYYARRPIVVNQGGTSSGKTYAILMVLAQHLADEPNSIATVIGQDMPNLLAGSHRDFRNIVAANPFLSARILREDRSAHSFRFANGSLLEFRSYDDAQDAKNGKRHYAFFNEANGIPYEVYSEIAVRTSRRVFIDYNPNGLFWVNKRIFTLPSSDYAYIHSTYAGNSFASPQVRQKILTYQYTDPFRWQVYGMGLLGRPEGLVFPGWSPVQSIPDEYDYMIYGLDFGFTNDPTALVRIVRSGSELYFQTLIYERSLTNRDLMQRMTDIGIGRNDIIYADSAEPKTINELCYGLPGPTGYRFHVIPALKGPDSIRSGISKLNEYKCHYLHSDASLADEVAAYKWVAIDGEPTNTPIDAHNHAIDDIRMAINTHTHRYKDA